jgi:Acyl-protein synthetase, LuxE
VLDETAFNDLALRLFAYQLRYNRPYAQYCESLGITPETLPASWEAIPAVPSPAFKVSPLTTFDPALAALTFETSGTTGGTGGRHYLETSALYDAALLAGFDRFMLADGARLRYFNLVPSPLDARYSSLGYMMMRVTQFRGDGNGGWYLQGGKLSFDQFEADLRKSIAENQAICIAATAFALVHLLDAMDAARLRVDLPRGSRVMETGGFKGRSRSVPHQELYENLRDRLGIELGSIVAEYGMTELSSQYYDREPRGGAVAQRRKSAPPWLRARVVDPQRRTLPNGMVGALLHVDLANRSSCIAVQTEDLGVQYEDGLVLAGRDVEAEPRGCSLDAEELTLRATRNR